MLHRPPVVLELRNIKKFLVHLLGSSAQHAMQRACAASLRSLPVLREQHGPHSHCVDHLHTTCRLRMQHAAAQPSQPDSALGPPALLTVTHKQAAALQRTWGRSMLSKTQAERSSLAPAMPVTRSCSRGKLSSFLLFSRLKLKGSWSRPAAQTTASHACGKQQQPHRPWSTGW